MDKIWQIFSMKYNIEECWSSSHVALVSVLFDKPDEIDCTALVQCFDLF